MDISILQQLTAFVASSILGIGLGILFEFFRTVRSLLGGRAAGVFVQDLLFWIVSAFVVYTFFLLFTNGIVRIFALIGCGLGFWIYMKTLGKITSFLFRQIFRPVKYLFGLLRQAVVCVCKRIFLHKKGKIISENT